MPDIPERDIERQLRQHAEQRRAAAGEPSLRPAARRLLQAEARRRWGGTSAERPPAGWRTRFWPRLALACGALVLLGIAVVMWREPHRAEPGPLAGLSEAPESPAEPALPTAAPTTPAPEAMASLPATAMAPGVPQFFRNAAIAPDGTAAPNQPPVLLNFSVAQDGNLLTVVDEDGSVYQGTVELADGLAPQQDGLKSADATAAGLLPATAARTRDHTRAMSVGARVGEPAETVAEGRNWRFKVAGTNRSLQQRVVFAGNLRQNAGPAAVQNAVTFQRQLSNAELNDQIRHGGAIAPAAFHNFILGRVRVGDQRETELNAVPVER